MWRRCSSSCMRRRSYSSCLWQPWRAKATRTRAAHLRHDGRQLFAPSDAAAVLARGRAATARARGVQRGGGAAALSHGGRCAEEPPLVVHGHWRARAQARLRPLRARSLHGATSERVRSCVRSTPRSSELAGVCSVRVRAGPARPRWPCCRVRRRRSRSPAPAALAQARRSLVQAELHKNDESEHEPGRSASRGRARHRPGGAPSAAGESQRGKRGGGRRMPTGAAPPPVVAKPHASHASGWG
jgi:hypothetical protein